MEIRLLENQRPTWRNAFEVALTTQCQALGITPSITTTLDGPVADGAFVRFFGNAPGSGTSSLVEALCGYLAPDAVVLPVLESPRVAEPHLPAVILHLNAFSLSRHAEGRWPAALVDEVLSLQWLGRRARRIFISYRRVNADAIARQLHEHLVQERFAAPTSSAS